MTAGVNTNQGATPVIRMSVQRQVGSVSVMTFETYVDQKTSLLTMHALADKMIAVADRQTKKAELVDINNYILKEEHSLKAMQEDLVRAEQNAQPRAMPGRKEPVQPSQKAAAELFNFQQSIGKKKEFIATLRKDRETREKELADEEQRLLAQAAKRAEKAKK